LAELTNPSTGGPGLLVRFLDDAGVELMREDRFATSLVFFAGNAPTLTASVLELSCQWTPTENGDVTVGFASIGRGRISVDGALVLDDVAVGDSTDVGANILDPPKAVAPVAVSVTAGRPVDVVLELDLAIMQETTDGAFGITLGVAPSDTDPEARIADAVAVAAASDVAIVVVGTNAQVESEGFDRSDLRLPGRQDDLVAAVAATGTPTVVVINSGSPVELPWRDDVSAIVLPYFGGQEMGNALADVLLGRVEPGGRLPTTWAASMADVPVLDVTPVDGKLEYAEGIHLGYRAWLRAGLREGLGEGLPEGLREVPRAAYPFGFGLGYATWELRDLVVEAPAASGADVRVGVTVTNTGARRGKQVVQVYLARPESSVDRPVRWLAGHAVVRADAGESVAVEISVPARAFAHWENGVGWAHEPGTFDVLVGTSVEDIVLSSTVTL
jgi:beta-glucosidase